MKKGKDRNNKISKNDIAKQVSRFTKMMDEVDEINSSEKRNSQEYSKDSSEKFATMSSFDTNFSSNLELMKRLRTLLLECLKVCDGAFKARPTQGNSYALTNMVSQVKEITERLEEAIDYEEVTENLVKVIIQPFIEKMILSLGTIISMEFDSRDKSERKVIKRPINNIYKKYAAEIEAKIPDFVDAVKQNILEQVK